MRDNKPLILRIYSQFSAILLGIGFIASSATGAHALTADDVMNKMTPDERTSYLAGAVEAFGQARWIADKPDASGIQCIQAWLYDDAVSALPRINQFFDLHPEKPASALLYVLIKKDCGG